MGLDGKYKVAGVEPKEEGCSLIAVEIDGEFTAWPHFEDTLRLGANGADDRIKRLGIQPVILSGDCDITVRRSSRGQAWG